jgi:hypothetical protein
VFYRRSLRTCDYTDHNSIELCIDMFGDAFFFEGGLKAADFSPGRCTAFLEEPVRVAGKEVRRPRQNCS